MNKLQTSFLEHVKVSLLNFEFHQAYLLPHIFTRSVPNGHLLIRFNFRPNYKVNIATGLCIHCIERIRSEFHGEISDENEPKMATTIGDSLSNFSSTTKFLIDLKTENYEELSQRILNEYKISAFEYFNYLSDFTNLLNELRNPSKITKSIINSRLTQSHLIMIAAYCMNDNALFRIVLAQEEEFVKNSLDEESYPSYMKLRSFLEGL